MLSAQSLATVNAFWRSYLGANVNDGPALHVVTHAPSLEDYNGAYCWMRDGRCVVSLPELVHNGMHRPLSALSPDDVFDAGTLRELFAASLDRIVGPASIGYLDRGDGLPPADPRVRRLGNAEDAAFRALADASGADDWENGGVELSDEAVFGAVDANQLVAVASYVRWGDHIAHVGFVTHPAFRQRGFGRAVAAAATRDAIGRALIAQWRTLESNGPSLAVSRRLGFEPYCRTIAVRFRR